MRLALLAAAAAAACDAQQVWTNLWAMPSGMNAVDPELATDGDNATQMRVFGPIRHGASVAVDMRSAVKVTHVVSAAAPPSLPRAACGFFLGLAPRPARCLAAASLPLRLVWLSLPRRCWRGRQMLVLMRPCCRSCWWSIPSSTCGQAS